MKLTVENLNEIYDMLSEFFVESSTVHWWDKKNAIGMVLDVERSFGDETTLTAVFKLSNSVEEIEKIRAENDGEDPEDE